MPRLSYDDGDNVYTLMVSTDVSRAEPSVQAVLPQEYLLALSDHINTIDMKAKCFRLAKKRREMMLLQTEIAILEKEVIDLAVKHH